MGGGLTGTVINMGSVLAGGTIGTLLGQRFPERLRSTLMQAIGLTTLAIGLQRVLPTEDVLALLASIVLGGILGEMLGIEDRLVVLATLAENRFGRSAKTTQTAPERRSRREVSTNASSETASLAARGFVTASLLFCVGPMTILGSFEDGLTGAYSTLALKSALDGVAALMLASSLGWGVLLAAGTILVYQGGLTLGATLLRGVLTDPMIQAITAVGGLLLLGLGLNILEITRIRVGSMLPALVVAPIIVALVQAWSSLERGVGG